MLAGFSNVSGIVMVIPAASADAASADAAKDVTAAKVKARIMGPPLERILWPQTNARDDSVDPIGMRIMPAVAFGPRICFAQQSKDCNKRQGSALRKHAHGPLVMGRTLSSPIREANGPPS